MLQILRPLPADVTDMIVRARFRVPDGTLHGGVQLRVGDLKVNGEKITTGGQVADLITMTLFAQAIPGAPVQQAAACRFRPCHDVNHPEFIVPIAFGSQCPDLGISPQIANIELAKAANFDFVTPDVIEDPAGAKSQTRHAINRARR